MTKASCTISLTPDTLLKTKLFIPPVRSNLVERPRLIQRLNEGAVRKLSLISAPPGFGKTTLVSEWFNTLGIGGDKAGLAHKAQDQPHHPEAGGQRPAAAWVSLDERDNDPVRFWSYIISALDPIQPDAGAEALSLLHEAQPPPIETTLTALINALTALDDHFLLVLDDYHLIETDAIHQGLAFLLEHLPPFMHLVITSRTDPPLPLTRLRVRNQLMEIRESDLRFTAAEAAIFLNQVMGLDLSSADIEALETRTEGWIAGLQLAALSMQEQDDRRGFVQAFTGSHRYIIDYLAEEVLARQPEQIKRFLLKTSILDRLSAPLCDAVLGETCRPAEQGSSQQILEHLEQTNLFLIPLDGERTWYRYHHLFADFLQTSLQQSLEPEALAELHRRASGWYADHNFIQEAINQALAAADFEQAADFIEQEIIVMLTIGEVTTVIGWLKALPEAMVRNRPRLALGQAWAFVIINNWAKIEPLIQDIEKGLLALENAPARTRKYSETALQEMWGELAALQAMLASTQGDFDRGIELCRQALQRVPEDNRSVRTIINLTLGNGYELKGDLANASRVLEEVQMISQATDRLTIYLTATSSLARIQQEQGLLHQSVELYRQALRLVEGWSRERGQPGRTPIIAGWTYLGLAEVMREQNELEAAKRYLSTGLQLAQYGNLLGNSMVVARLIEAQIRQAEGDRAGALQAIQQAQESLPQLSPVELWVSAVQARLWLAQGNLSAAAHWAENCGLPLDGISEDRPNDRSLQKKIALIHYGNFPGEYTTLVRIFIAQERFEAALELLKHLKDDAKTTERTGRLVETAMLQAIALYGRGDTGPALVALVQALGLGQPGGYVRLFVDEGTPVAQLLHLIKSRGLAPDRAYLDKLLAAMDRPEPAEADPPARTAQPQSLPEDLIIDPLSERELEVLRHIAEGLSNREIAEKLFITVGTAKTHANNIYRKLDVRSRTQAVARATELGLL